MLPLITKTTIASVVRIEIRDQHLGENCRVYGICCQVVSPSDETAENLEALCGRVIDQGTGSEQGKWLVATSSGTTRWFHSEQLKPLGPTFPQSVSLGNLRITSLPSAVKLRGVGSFPLQALEHLCLADNELTCLPDDLSLALPGLISLDLSGNKFSSLPCAIAHMAWLKRVSLHRQQGTLHDKSWLDAVLSHNPSFLEMPPNALECVLVDFTCASPHSKTLVISLATRTIQRCSATCIDLRGRGIGDDALDDITPQLLECCARRQGLIECLRNGPNMSASAISLPLVHAHPLVSASQSTTGLSSRDDFCDACGRGKLSHATGLVCETLGCDFSLCVECTTFLSEVPNKNHCLRTVDADGHQVQFSLRCAAARSQHQSSSRQLEDMQNSSLELLVDGELIGDAVQVLVWNSRKRVLTVEKELMKSHSMHLRNDTLAAGLVLQLEKLCARAKSPTVEWRGDAATQGPVCHLHGHPMQVSAKSERNGVDELSVQWEYEDGEYQPFEPEAQREIELAFTRREDTTVISFRNPRKSGFTTYEYNLRTMTQTNTETRYTRSIRRIDKADAEGWRCGECYTNKLGSAWRCCACSMHTAYCLQCWPPVEAAADTGTQLDTLMDDELPCQQYKKAATSQHLLEVPLVDLRENPITQLPPSLCLAVSYFGAGVILSDLSGPCGPNDAQQASSSGASSGISCRGKKQCDDDAGMTEGGSGMTCAVEKADAGKAVWCANNVVKHLFSPEHKYRYTGAVKDNKEHGRGKRIFRDSSIFEGEFVHGKRHGPAVHTFKQGQVWSGSFKDDVMEKYSVLVNGCCRYEGEMKQEASCGSVELAKSLPHGKGDMYMPHGMGVMVYQHAKGSKVTRYDGCWKQGKRHGHGMLVWRGSQDAMLIERAGSAKAAKNKEEDKEEDSELQMAQNAGMEGEAIYVGSWEEDMLQGQGVLSWSDGRALHGSFMSGRVERGFLVTPLGSWLLTFSENCPKFSTDTGDVPELPHAFKRQDMGRISGDVMAAIKNGASEAYAHLASINQLSVADRIKVMNVHASENPPEVGRQALKIAYAPGAKDAAANILRSLIQPQAQEEHSHVISVAKNLQWAIELEKPEAPTSVMALDERGKSMRKEDLKRELERRGLDSHGLKPALEARLEEALALERPINAAELKMPLLKKELEKRGLDCKGLKRELVVRLQDDIEKGRKSEAQSSAAVDEIQEMFTEAGHGLASIEVAGMLPLLVSAADSLQPEPLASSMEMMTDMSQWYQALGRLIGGALWHRKTLPVPISRFFCRRILEMVPTYRLKAYSAQGKGPPVFSGGVSTLLGTRLTVSRDDGLDDTRWKHCPYPRLERASPGSSYVVKQVLCCRGVWFVRMQERQEHLLGQNGWMPLSNTTAKVENFVEPEAAWREMRRQNSEFPYNACFPKSVSSGQPVRVRAVHDPPRFYSSGDISFDESSSTNKPTHPEMLKRMAAAKNKEFAKCLCSKMSQDKSHILAQIAADQQRTLWHAEHRRKQAREERLSHGVTAFGGGGGGESSSFADMFPERDASAAVLVGTNDWASGEGVCVLPSWIMDTLGLVDGDEVQVEALQPPLNHAQHTMTRGSGRFSTFWYCGRKKKRNRSGSSGHLARCGCGPDKGEPCAQCDMVESPDCSGGLPRAGRVVWRLPCHRLAGEVGMVLKGGKHLGELFTDRALQCVMQDVAVPLIWGASGSEGDQVALALRPEGVWNCEGALVKEAVLSPHTIHQLLPPLETPPRGLQMTSDAHEVSQSKTSGGAAARGGGKQPLLSESSATGKSTNGKGSGSDSGSNSKDELLTGEMISDYLENAAADDTDRDQVKKNEFEWLLRNNISDLEAEGLLPPRFAGIGNGLTAHTLVSPAKESKTESMSVGAPSKKRDADGKQKAASASAVAADASVSGNKEGMVEKEFFSVLSPGGGRVGEVWQGGLGEDEKSRLQLLCLWLRRKLHEEVLEQSFAVSRGLREVMPPGVLALFSAAELQALLGGGPAVSDAALQEWKATTEYGNGLTAEDERVKWFWEAVKGMEACARAAVWKFATGLTHPPSSARGGFVALQPRFNLVAEMVRSDCATSGSSCQDWTLITAATCHRQLVLPRFSSAQVTARQLQCSVEEGLALAAGEPDGFEAVQRQLLAAVQRASARESAVSSGAAVQEALRKLFPNSYMCGKCGFGPVDHVACTDLRSHHGEKRGGAQICNACPKCAWFSPQVTDWPPWDGRVWAEQDENDEVAGDHMGASSSAVRSALKRRRRDTNV